MKEKNEAQSLLEELQSSKEEMQTQVRQVLAQDVKITPQVCHQHWLLYWFDLFCYNIYINIVLAGNFGEREFQVSRGPERVQRATLHRNTEDKEFMPRNVSSFVQPDHI